MTNAATPAPTLGLRAMIVDDEPLARDELAFVLGELGVEVIAQAATASAALAAFGEASPDVVFVDLRMPGPDGLALAEAIHARAPATPIVVVSAHDEGALRGFEVGVADYVLKPVRLERLKRALDRVRARLDAGPNETEPTLAPLTPGQPLTRLAVRRRNAYVVVDLEEVVYLEMKDELVWAVTREDRFALDLTLSALEDRLPEAFFRSHRGYLVRVDRILAIEPAGAGTFDLVLDHPSKPKVPLARERARLLRERIPIAG
ncbi:MAG: response regulator transcription factor [Deltaproteobacteria bacterium]|nr:response regulator transcription factor [Deltaproteobacteria bacterium]